MSETENIIDIADDQVEFISNDADAAAITEKEDGGPPFTSPGAQFSPPHAQESEAGEESAFTRFVKHLPDDSASASIIVTRHPDHMVGIKPRTPCEQKVHVATFPWNNQTEDEIDARIQNTEGGGYYFFQVRVAEGMTQYKWRKIINDPAGPTKKEETILQLADAKAVMAGAVPKAQQGEPQPALVAQPAPPAEKAKTLVEQLGDMKDIFETMRPIFAPPMPPAITAPPHVPLKERIAEQLLQALVTDANNGDMNSKRLIGEIAKDALGLNKGESEPAALTLTGALAGYIDDPSKITEGIKAIGDGVTAFMENMPQPKVPDPKTVSLVDKWRKKPGTQTAPAKPATAAPAAPANNAPAASPISEVTDPIAPEPETAAPPPTPRKRTMMAKGW